MHWAPFKIEAQRNVAWKKDNHFRCECKHVNKYNKENQTQSNDVIFSYAGENSFSVAPGFGVRESFF